MNGGFIRGGSAIVGAATYGIGESPGQTSMDLAAMAAMKALADAQLELKDVDGLFICLPDDMLSGLSFAEYLGVHPNITNNNRTGGSAFLTHATLAAMAIDAGLCDVALIAYGSNMRTGAGKLIPPPGSTIYEAPYGVSLAASYALATARHMHQYGTTRHQLAEVAVAAREWAMLNPEAYRRQPLTVEDVITARSVASPLTVHDCCLVCDGAAAVVITAADRARDLKQRPAYLLGAGEATSHRYIAQMADITQTAAVYSGASAFRQAGCSPRDIDVLQLYDAFTINPILFLEDLGFCKKGEGGAFIQNGRIAPGGDLPVNTNGGGLSCVHPGMYGLFTMVEAARQIEGTCGARQVSDVNLALAHGNGGVLSSQATLILGSTEAV